MLRLTPPFQNITIGPAHLPPGKNVVAVVSITDPGEPPPRWLTAFPARLHLSFSDITAQETGHPLKAMSDAQMLQLIHWARSRDRGEPTHFHCTAGMSRSPACAAAFLAAQYPSWRYNERAILRDLREVRPAMNPNPHVLALADRHLGRRLLRTAKGK